MKAFFFILILSFSASAQQKDYGYLKPQDQNYYKNDSFEGMNKQERIDSLVKEVNKLHSEMASLKSEMNSLKADVEALKNKK